MKKRTFLQVSMGLASSLGLSVISGFSTLFPKAGLANSSANLFENDNVDEILLSLFNTTDVGEDGSIRIETSQQAESNLRIPFRITARYAEKVAVVAHSQSKPLILVADTSSNPDGVVIATMDLQQSSKLTCYVLKQGQLSGHSVFVRTPDQN